ncbi:hypothetical protein [Saccharopolyspora rosea]|uniref:Uncharacterized protein n=1 Tax=Saccharopolyspora rosea TaxID=524884 RepID=A0ABW3G3W0_9PSEU|nr:hypothetical protein [Saccharopolyspora rosea]
MTDTALREAVLDRLDEVDRAVTSGEPETLLPAAREDLYRLTEALRALLDQHRPGENGRCPSCHGTRSRPWPCAVWLAGHRLLVTDRAPRHADHSERATAPRAVRVLPNPIVASGERGPGDWDTGEFARVHPTSGRPHTAARGRRLETDPARIHRAAVVERGPRWP